MLEAHSDFSFTACARGVAWRGATTGGHLVQMPLSGHHITFRLLPSSRSFVLGIFMIMAWCLVVVPVPVSVSASVSASVPVPLQLQLSSANRALYGRTMFTPLFEWSQHREMQFIKWLPRCHAQRFGRNVWQRAILLMCACPMCFSAFMLVRKVDWRQRDLVTGDWGLERGERRERVLLQKKKCICQSLLSPFDT